MVDHPDDPHYGMIDWYYYYSWKNQLGTFLTFATPDSPLSLLYGYRLHKKYPNLKFVYRSIDEGWPNNCGKWEFDQNDPISDEIEDSRKDLEMLRKALILLRYSRNSDLNSLEAVFNGDKEKTQRILLQYLEEDQKYGYESVNSDKMLGIFRNDPLFHLTKEEMINYDYPPDKTETMCGSFHTFWVKNS